MVAKQDFFQPIKELFPQNKDFLGEVGIEIEIEGYNIPKTMPSYWAHHKEGSLRGESAEFALKRPASRKTYPKLLEYFNKQLTKAGAECVDSVRTSVHVHLNMNKKTLVECYNLVMCYLIVEDLFTTFAGETRVGNIFCLRARDAEDFIDYMAQAARTKMFYPDGNAMRYTGISICAIPKFNSIEFRALRGTTDINLIQTWVEMLLALKDAAETYETPPNVVADMSILGPAGFLKKLIPVHHADIKELVPDWSKVMWESVRLAQEIAFATDWVKPEAKVKTRFFPVGVVEEEEKPIEPKWELE